jgi:acetoin utilization protein AcuB
MLKNVKVSEWMSSTPVTIDYETPIVDAHQLMRERNVRRLPVLKNDRLVGIVTIGDIREASPSDATTLSVWEMNYLLSKLTVEKVMTKNPITVKPEDPVKHAAQLMLDKKLSGLPVINAAGDLVGIITESDIFRMVVQNS